MATSSNDAAGERPLSEDSIKPNGRSAGLEGDSSGSPQLAGGARDVRESGSNGDSKVHVHKTPVQGEMSQWSMASGTGLSPRRQHHDLHPTKQSALDVKGGLEQDHTLPSSSSPSSQLGLSNGVASSSKVQEPFRSSPVSLSSSTRARATPSPIDTKLASRSIKRGSLREGERRPISPHITTATPTAARHSINLASSSPQRSNSDRRSSVAPVMGDAQPTRQNSLGRKAAQVAQGFVDAVSGHGGRNTPPASIGYPYRPDSASAISRRHVASPDVFGSAHELFDGTEEYETVDDESGKGHKFPVPPNPPRRSSTGPTSGRWTPTILSGLASRRADGAGFSPVNFFHSSHNHQQHQSQQQHPRHHIVDQSPKVKGLVLEPEETEGKGTREVEPARSKVDIDPDMSSADGRKTPAQYRPQPSSHAKRSYYPPETRDAQQHRTKSHPLSHTHSMSTSSTSNSSHSIHMQSPPSMSMSPSMASHSRHTSFQRSPVLLAANNSASGNSSPLVVPQARRGAMNLKKARRRQRNGTRRARSSLSTTKSPSVPAHEQVLRIAKAVCHAVAHPMQSARQLVATGASTLREVDNAFRDQRTGMRTWRPAWLSAYVPLLIWLVVSLGSTFTVLIWHTQVFRALDSLSTHLQELGLKGRVILGALIFITTFPPLPLYSTLIILCGFSFGLVQGFIISYIAALSGAIVVFLLSRSLLRGWMLGLLNQSGGLKKVVRAIEKRPKLLFLVRLAPYPYNLMNTLLASSPTLTLKTYTLCTALALPKLLVHCGLGTTIKNFAAYNGAGAAAAAPATSSSESDGVTGSDQDRPIQGGIGFPSSNTTMTAADEASASETAELIKHVAGFLGVGLCIGIFIYLFTVARRAVDEELDEDDDAQEYELVLSDDEEEEEDAVDGHGQAEDVEDELDADRLSIGGRCDHEGGRKSSGGSATDSDSERSGAGVNRHYRIPMSDAATSSVLSPQRRSGPLLAAPSQHHTPNRLPHGELHHLPQHPRFPSDGATPNFVASVPGGTYFSSTNHTPGFFAYYGNKNDGVVVGDSSVVSLADSIAEMEKQVECTSEDYDYDDEALKDAEGRFAPRELGRGPGSGVHEVNGGESDDEKQAFLHHR